MKALRNIIAGLLIAAMPLGVTMGSASATASNTCSVKLIGGANTANQSNSHFWVGSGAAHTTVIVSGPSTCKETVTIASWKAPYNSVNFAPYTQQTLVAQQTATFGVGSHGFVIPIETSCMYQVDVVKGASPYGRYGGAQYAPDQMIGYVQGNFGTMCKSAPAPTPTPTPTPKPPTTTTTNVCSGNMTNVNNGGTAAQGGNCSTNTTVVQNNPTPPAQTTTTTSTPAPTQAQPTALVNTGPGSVVTLFGIATIAGYFIRRTMLRKAFQG